MTKEPDHASISDSEFGSERAQEISKIRAVIGPMICALLLVTIFAVSFIGTKLAYEQYGTICTTHRFDVTRFYIFPNISFSLGSLGS